MVFALIFHSVETKSATDSRSLFNFESLNVCSAQQYLRFRISVAADQTLIKRLLTKIFIQRRVIQSKIYGKKWWKYRPPFQQRLHRNNRHFLITYTLYTWEKDTLVNYFVLA